VKTAPAGDSYEAIVAFAMPANVDTIIPDGRTLRAGGKLTAFDHGELVAEAPEAAVGSRGRGLGTDGGRRRPRAGRVRPPEPDLTAAATRLGHK
jgi:5-methylthioadenosine/S-adenosylhomocysteine deaminase